MKIFAIADLHLPGNNDKTMDRFGENWVGHFSRISAFWRQSVGQEDVVLIPGDISWAMHWEDAVEDLRELSALPGRKILLRGNHDYWWESPSKMLSKMPENILFIQNNALEGEHYVVAGSRGWIVPSVSAEEQDLKIYQRELIRLELSLQKAAKFGKPILVMMHFPPLTEETEQNGFTDLFEKYGVSGVIYGHLHGYATLGAFNGVKNGTHYQLVSCDSLGFQLWQIPESWYLPGQ